MVARESREAFEETSEGLQDSTDGGDGAPRTSRDLQKEETRRRVYEAALQIFRRDGVELCRIEDIARLAGVSRGTFYFHFPTKQDVLFQLISETQQVIANRVEELPEDADLATALATFSAEVAATWENERELFADVSLAALKKVTPSPEKESLFRIRLVLAERFQKAEKELNRLVPPAVLADLFLVNQFAVAVAWTSNLNPGPDLRQALDGAAYIFLNGARGS